MFDLIQPVINYSVRDECAKAYHGHPKGCPNFGKRDSCPPRSPKIEQVIDMEKPVYVIYNVFPFGEWIAKMRAAHPGWSDRQCANCLYWQPRARMQLRQEIALFNVEHPGRVVLTCPEACGVNVTATMKFIGHHLEWPPKTVTYQVAIAGSKACST